MTTETPMATGEKTHQITPAPAAETPLQRGTICRSAGLPCLAQTWLAFLGALTACFARWRKEARVKL